MSIEALKERSRLALHRKMSRRASFYESSGSQPEFFDVRTNYKPKNVGDLAGTNLSYAETLEQPTRLIFWVEDLAVAGVNLYRNTRVVFSSDEGYYIDVVHPKDGYTVMADVTALSEEDIAGLALPE